jgi:lipid II:glycine glycyltransferase (peptidoglycan interpeptide bridge formation enzyme)
MKVVLAETLSASDGVLYDAFVLAAPSGHYSQSRDWALVARAGKSVQSTYFLATNDGEVVAAGRILRPKIGPLLGPVATIERGPICKTPEILESILPLLVRALRRRGVARISVMPYFADDEKKIAEAALRKSGFRDVQKADGAHVRTLRVDLPEKKANEIFSGGDRESLRRKLKQAEKAGVHVRLGNRADVATLQQLHDAMMSSQSKRKKSRAYFEALAAFVEHSNRGAIFVAEHDQKSIAALFAISHGPLATFVIGATSQAQLPFSKMASAMAEAIRWAHARQCASFDLGGIPVENDANPKRASIAQFKFDFSKSTIDLAHEHARWF